MRKPSLLVIFFTVFMDLIGFGIVLPLLPIYSRNFGASGLMISLMGASYSAVQFVFAPAWGRLSDRIGRRPVLLVSTAGAIASYAIFAVGSALTGKMALAVILGSRILAGICAANITVAQAYIADITPPEDRSRRMGLIGMAFGLGFIFGPPIGSISHKYLGITAPGWVAASLCAANFILAFCILPESWKPSSEHLPPRPRLTQWVHTVTQPKIGLLIVIFFLATFCFTCFEWTLGLLIAQNFHLDIKRGEDAEMAGYLFTYCGIIGAFVQGGAIGRLIKTMGEPKLIAVSLVLVALSLVPLPFVHGSAPLFSWRVLGPEGLPWLTLLILLAILSIGSGLTRPPLFGLISILTPAHEQGATIGVAQGAGSLARVFGPMFAIPLFVQVSPILPYTICGGISLVAAFVAWQSLCRVEQPVVAPQEG